MKIEFETGMMILLYNNHHDETSQTHIYTHINMHAFIFISSKVGSLFSEQTRANYHLVWVS